MNFQWNNFCFVLIAWFGWILQYINSKPNHWISIFKWNFMVFVDWLSLITLIDSLWWTLSHVNQPIQLVFGYFWSPIDRSSPCSLLNLWINGCGYRYTAYFHKNTLLLKFMIVLLVFSLNWNSKIVGLIRVKSLICGIEKQDHCK